ncbi:restriction endonuclease subunit S [Pseudoalteromonas sp. B131b]|uniref:restriction endonuclease subunit S n=1 Tax=Pseudoalteromonas sp. B131b TaxID=630493 RepID=UPI00301D2741
MHVNFPLCINYYNRHAKGTAQKGIYLGKLSLMPLAIPPLAEQHRIVAKVDELMALCDQLEQQTEQSISAHKTLVQVLLNTLTASFDAHEFNQNWARIAEHFDTLFTTEDSIEQLKQAILQLAVMGKLVAQDVNDEPTSKLLKIISDEKKKLISDKSIKKVKELPKLTNEDKLFDLPNGWEWGRFQDIAANVNNALKAGPFGSALKKSMYVETGFKIYGQEQVISGDENLGDYYIDNEKYESLSSCKVASGDILISLVGTIGKVLVLSENCQPGIINPRLVKISLFESINRKFIQNILASPLIQFELSEKSHGGTMNILNLGLLKELVFPIPPIEEQERICTKVFQLMTICNQLKLQISEARQSKVNLAEVLVQQGLSH